MYKGVLLYEAKNGKVTLWHLFNVYGNYTDGHTTSAGCKRGFFYKLKEQTSSNSQQSYCSSVNEYQNYDNTCLISDNKSENNYFNENALPATLKQQEELAKHCYSVVTKYWNTHPIELGLKNMQQDSPDVDEFYEKTYQKNRKEGYFPTYKDALDLGNTYFNIAMKDPSRNLDCKVLSAVVKRYLDANQIKNRYVHANVWRQGNLITHDTVMYAVITENDGETWFMCDPRLMLEMELATRYLRRPVKFGNLLKPTDAAKMPLIEYSDNKIYGYGEVAQPFVYAENPKTKVDPKTYSQQYAPLLSEWVHNNCDEVFKNKFLVKKISDIEKQKLDSHEIVFTGLSSPTRRLLVESLEKNPQPSLYRDFKLEAETKDGKRHSFALQSYLMLTEGMDETIRSQIIENNLGSLAKGAKPTGNDVQSTKEWLKRTWDALIRWLGL